MSLPRAVRLERVLAAVLPEDRAWVAAQLETRSEAQRRRLEARDDVVRECFTLLGDLEAKPAARRIETELGRYLASGWLLERDGMPPRPDPPGLAGAIRRLARANGGQTLGVRQLLNVWAGDRGGGAKISRVDCTRHPVDPRHGTDARPSEPGSPSRSAGG